jgi:hypothetical protein
VTPIIVVNIVQISKPSTITALKLIMISQKPSECLNFHFTSQFILMAAVQPERIPLSKRVQAAVAHAITAWNRPLTVCEIERFISLSDPKLNADISKKSHDYIRIILAPSHAPTFGKFISLLEKVGPDHPIIYFGVTTVAYDPQVWSLLVSKSDEPKQKCWPPQKAGPVLKPGCVRQAVGNISHLVADDASEIVEAWTKSSTERDLGDLIWLAFLQAFGFLNEVVAFGVSPLAIVPAILCSLPSLRETEIVSEMEMLLRNIAGKKQEEMRSIESGSEPSVWQIR